MSEAFRARFKHMIVKDDTTAVLALVAAADQISRVARLLKTFDGPALLISIDTAILSYTVKQIKFYGGGESYVELVVALTEPIRTRALIDSIGRDVDVKEVTT